jgi:uncharacterized membrane protein (UPF0182 family)
MTEHMPPDDDPIIRSLRDAGIRPLPPRHTRPPVDPRRRAIAIAVAAVAILLFILLPAIIRRLSDWLWYREIGFERVFFTKIVAQWSLGVVTACVAFAILYGTARWALRGLDADRELIFQPLRGGGRSLSAASRAMLERGVGFVAFAGSAFLALLFGLGIAGQWRTALQFLYRSSFGVADPVFGRDVGYYVFSLPAIELVTGLLVGLLALALFAIALPTHIARGAVSFSGWRPMIRSGAERQLTLLAALLFLVLAIRIHYVRLPGLLFGSHLPLSGANFVDLHVRLPALHLLTLTAVVGAILIVWGGWRGRLGPMAVRVIAGYAIVGVIAAVIPALYQRLIVQPNELARETPQIVHHISATRQAWGIDSVQLRELGTESALTPQIIAANRATIDNVRLWDREPLLQTFGQIQSIRTYYDFHAIDDDRYRIGGQLRQVMLSAREMNTSALPTRGFINEHLTYTHGMGVALGPSNEVTAEGLPVLFIKNLPPVSSIEVTVTRPQIYYGEMSNDFVLAPTRQREFDYPAGEGDAAAYSSYDGRGGVPVASFARRLLYAFRFGSMNILLSRDLNDRTRILYHRDIRERAERALPFLLLDRDPYLVIANDGRLQWILDGYTASDRYPYAQGIAGGINYMRNSVKIVVDAYDGTVTAYLVAPNDPIIRTLSRIYPGLLKPLAAMPADLRAHLRYPEDLFRVQTTLFATFHMNNPETFYHREDQWQIPGVARASGPIGAERQGLGEAFLRHIVMRLPGEPDPEFILMRPFTPRQKDNLAAWMVARNDGDKYGQLAVFRFPRQSLVFGPNQIVNRINQDTEVARQITLWDQRGSEVVRGELLVLPVEGSLIYVQPLYLRAEGGRIPELKRVVAAHEGRVAMAETLDAALASLFGGSARAPSTVVAATAADSTRAAAPATVPAVDASEQALTRRALDHYDRARAAQRADDWSAYGEEMRKLGEVLRQLEARRRP